jgi:hypothetical protein
MNFLSNWIFWVVIGILIIIFLVWKLGRKSISSHAIIKEEEILPYGYTPTIDAVGLHEAMKGLGTDYESILDILTGKTKGQLAAIYNEFNSLYFNEGYGDLFQWFEDDLSGDDYDLVMQFFDGIQFSN